MVRARAAKKEKEEDGSGSSLEGKSISIGVSEKAISKASTGSASKKRTEKAISQFLTDVLPALKKEMVKRKKEPFSWEPYRAYFKADSHYIQTFILPLFKFLEKDEIVCTRYGCFDNKHMVKTGDGFERVMLLSRHCDTNELPGDVQQYLSKRFGKEWFKIPSKDGFRAKAAAAAGHDGCFKVILTGLFEDSFQDVRTGETVYTINPILEFEPCRPPPPKKERSITTKKKKEKKEEEEEEENGGSGSGSGVVEVGAQEVPIEPVDEEEEEE